VSDVASREGRKNDRGLIYFFSTNSAMTYTFMILSAKEGRNE